MSGRATPARCSPKFRHAASACGCATGTRLNQLRFRDAARAAVLDGEAIRARHAVSPLVDRPLSLREGLIVHVGLAGEPVEIVGYRAIKNSDVIDVDRSAAMPRRTSGSRSSRGSTGD